MQKRFSAILFAIVLALSFAASTSTAAASSGSHGPSVPITTSDITWE